MGSIFMDFTSWGYAGVFFFICVFFTYFYTAIAVNPKEMADTMKRQGGFIPGIRPGRQTSEFIDNILTRITLAGGVTVAAEIGTHLACGRVEEALPFLRRAQAVHDRWVDLVPRLPAAGLLLGVGSVRHRADGREGGGHAGASATCRCGWFAAMDSAHEHKFNFNEAISFLVSCDTQEEIDDYWQKLSAVPEAEQCGWLKDKFGVSWQVVPSNVEQLLNDSDPARLERVMKTFLQMKKIDLAALERARAE